MKELILVLLLGSIALAYSVVGCKTSNDLSKESVAAIADVARARIANTHPAMDEESKLALSAGPNHFRYYRLAGNVYDYSIEWKLPQHKIVRLFGKGDIQKLSNSKIEMRAISLGD